MDCDAKKKCMVKDLDGTFLEIGSGGAALPQSEVSLCFSSKVTYFICEFSIHLAALPANLFLADRFEAFILCVQQRLSDFVIERRFIL